MQNRQRQLHHLELLRRIMNTSPPQFLAFDLGASHGRALLGTLDNADLDVEEVHRFKTPLLEEGERLFWDLEVLEREVDAGVRAALDSASNLRSLSVDAWGVDFVPLDAEGTPLRNPRAYRDPRTQAVMDATLEEVSREEIYAVTGTQFMPINTLYQVRADREMEPALVDRTVQRLFIADYLHYRYSGRAVAELSIASTAQLMDVRTHEWATDLMERLDINPTTWPKIVPPATCLGSFEPPTNSPFETRNSTFEIVAGCSHDTACAVAAAPAEDDGSSWAYLSCGTWSLLGVEREESIFTDAAREAGYTNEIGLDSTVRFLKNLTGLWVLQECERTWEASGESVDYDTLQREAAAAPSPDGVLDLDQQQFLERGEMPQKIRRYCRDEGLSVPETKGQFARLILESLAADYRDKLTALEAIVDEQIDVLHLVGGGSRNELLCQWTADATGCRVVAGPAEATALGNLLIQARTMGALPDGWSIRDIVRANVEMQTYEPDSSRVSV